MVKYIEDMTDVVFSEIPDRVSLAINITNCQNRCKGCFEAFLQKDIGKELDEKELMSLIAKNDGVEVILFMGEGNDPETLKSLAKAVKAKTGLETALYSGREKVEDELYDIFDYVKIGPYKAEFGPLNKKTTNQRLYHIVDGERKDITQQFWIKPWDLNPLDDSEE